MRAVLDQNNIYIKPAKQNETSKLIDGIVHFSIVGAILLGLVSFADTHFFNYGFGEMIFSTDPRFVLGYILLIFILGFLNGTHNRKKLSRDDNFELISELIGKKVKNNIAFIVQENGGISIGELKAIIYKMKSEICDLREVGYQEMLQQGDISEKTKSLINTINKDINLIEYYIAKDKK